MIARSRKSAPRTPRQGRKQGSNAAAQAAPAEPPLVRSENPETDVAPDRIDAARQAGDRDDSRTDVAPDRIDADRQERDRDADSTVCGLPSKEE